MVRVAPDQYSPEALGRLLQSVSLRRGNSAIDRGGAAGPRLPGRDRSRRRVGDRGFGRPPRFVIANGSPFFGKDNRLLGAVVALRNVTDRKRVEDEQRLATDRMAALLNINRLADRPMDEIEAAVVEEAIRVTRSRIGYLALLNADESVLTMHYWSKAAHAACRVPDKTIVYPVAQTGLLGEAVRQDRKPIVTNDYAAPSRYKCGLPEGHVPLTRHMNIPVFDGEHIVAVAGVGNKGADYTSTTSSNCNS